MRIIRQSSRYAMGADDELYKKSFSKPLLKCLGPEDAYYDLSKVHKGICGLHLGAKALTRQVIKVGFL